LIIFSYLDDDGLFTPDVGPWAEEKYKLVDLYCSMFSTSMKNKWDYRIYIDLYAGSGRSINRNTNKILPGSPLLALSVKDKFDKYIFCEIDSNILKVLEKRVSTPYPNIDVSFIAGDCNTNVNKILGEFPSEYLTPKTLSFCFIDPFNIGIKFETIKALSKRKIDFLILFAGGIDGNRNEGEYVKPDNFTVDEYLGINDWRPKWEEVKKTRLSFAQYLAMEYCSQMENLGYIKPPTTKVPVVRSSDKNLPLYHVAFFSRHKLGNKFWDQVLKYSNPQQTLPGID